MVCRVWLLLWMFAASFLGFSSSGSLFPRDWSSCSIHISLCCFLHTYCPSNFLPWLSYDSLYWGDPPWRSSNILLHFQVCLQFLYFSSLLFVTVFPANCDRISCILCRYPCVGFLHKGIFRLILNYLYNIVHSFSFILTRYCHRSFQ